MIFKDGECLTAKELKARLGICSKTWDRYRARILEHLALYCDFQVLGKTPRVFYQIVHQFSEYEKFEPRKSAAELKVIYSEEIVKSVQRHPLATYTSINLDIVKQDSIASLNKAMSTSYSYVRTCTPIILGKGKGGQGKIGHVADKVWAQKIKDQWYELPEDQLTALKKYFNEAFDGNEEKTIDVITDRENDVISPAEAQTLINDVQNKCYDVAMARFQSMFGFRPMKVYKYEVAPWAEGAIQKSWFEKKKE